jgi:hypothetical protein
MYFYRHTIRSWLITIAVMVAFYALTWIVHWIWVAAEMIKHAF